MQLGITPRYLDPRCQEAFYEVDVGVNEMSDGLASAVASQAGAGDRRAAANSASRSPQETRAVRR
ncbi:MAG: hypothetical protein P0111_07350 [Nitrospira sp.]|nr:hypothetical protein [Nitrospira sp.]